MNKRILILLFVGALLFPLCAQSQTHSVARRWNEALLHAISRDFARPPVHARNLFHTSIALYDAWAVYDTVAETFLLGKNVGGYQCNFQQVPIPAEVKAAQEEAMSYAAFRLLSYRFQNSPGVAFTMPEIQNLMTELGYNPSFTSTDYSTGSPAALGNYLAQCIIMFGFQDGSNELFNFTNQYYQPVNPPLVVKLPGNPDLEDPNRWQPLTLDVFIDQSGNVIPFNTPPFMGPEWGNVIPFSLNSEDRTVYSRDGYNYNVYHDPGEPPFLDINTVGGLSEEYKWNFALVSAWSGQLDPADTVMWDISPGAIGNNQALPTTVEGLRDFYDLENGGDHSPGHSLNPKTGQPYSPQIVRRSDYARVLAEFWADGPASVTPPGHWFEIMNYVSDHPAFEKRFNGQGAILDDLEWDVKVYFALGGTMHDAAITAWGIKGWYDGIRPISAIRYMADLGQSTDAALPSYHPGGIHLIPGYIELVQAGDTLAGPNGENIGKIKLYAWRGPTYIANPAEDVGGVDWILAENWWPYQRPSFVTPPFAGYISGHSTYSRAAAEMLTHLTGDAFFPGGMGEFVAPKNEFLVFENGPTDTLILQWATYRDASDQCSLSRIWGGIHPPFDDIPGRLIGIEIADEAFQLAQSYFFKDEDLDGFYSNVDCNDQNAAINANATELCDGIDNNCDAQIDEGLAVYAYYADIDNDGYGNTASPLSTCATEPPSGFVLDQTDCNDSDAEIQPGLAEVCDSKDNDCNGMIDDALQINTYFVDNDSDAYGDAALTVSTCEAIPPSGYVINSLDCNDNDLAINPASAEVCDGIDNNCNGAADEELILYSYYIDSDNDSFGSADVIVDNCLEVPPSGYVAIAGDCDDANAAIFPGATEILDTLDNDCDGEVDEGIVATTEPDSRLRRIFPNPTHDAVYIRYEHAGLMFVRIFSAEGTLLQTDKISFAAGTGFLSLAKLPQGIYLIVFEDAEGRRHFVERVVKM